MSLDIYSPHRVRGERGVKYPYGWTNGWVVGGSMADWLHRWTFISRFVCQFVYLLVQHVPYLSIAGGDFAK